MEIFKDKVSITDKITLGGDRMVLFAGPCAAESYDICMETGKHVKAICEELGIAVEEKLFTTDELKQADAAFYCGTAAEVIGWESLDNIKFPKPWTDSLSRQIQLAYKNLVVEKELSPLKQRNTEKEFA